MPSSPKNALFGFFAWAALAALFGALPGCAQEGATPTCVNNVTADGMQNNVDDACLPFGQCIRGGKARPAIECCCADLNTDDAPDRYSVQGGDCVDSTNDSVVTGSRITTCLYGYGAYDLPPDGSGDGGGGNGGGAP